MPDVRGGARLRDGVTAAIGAAALAELAEEGYRHFSMASVARRAGVGKAALYRRWPSKEPMIADLVLTRAVDVADVPDTGSLRGDLRAFVGVTAAALADPTVARIVADLLAEALRNPELAALLRRTVSGPRRDRVRSVLARAAARGEVPPGLDEELALDLLAGPLAVRRLVTGARVDDAYLDRLASALTAALAG